ncbi:MAG: TIGR01777 family oxidoreductase [Verrucomicrobiales bacterium]|nr:TIGR01777 family oxidoreductase [Verrucomicrobiales bacterium]
MENSSAIAAQMDQGLEKIVITGGSGFLGKSLARHLSSKGYKVIIVSRHCPANPGPWIHKNWDGINNDDWSKELEGASAIVNLAGRSVDCRKTPKNCAEILDSRVNSVKAVGEALEALSSQPKVWIQMSTAHIYGDPPTELCTEDSPFGEGLAPTVGEAWERAYKEHAPDSVRQVILRTSFVIGNSGGAFPKLKALAKFGLGGKAGNGKQGISWIHEKDMNELMQQCIEDNRYNGTYIATAPEPVSYATFMISLRRALRSPLGLPAPAWLIRLGAKFILRTDPELILLGRYCKSTRLEKEGFRFKFPNINDALEDLCLNN